MIDSRNRQINLRKQTDRLIDRGDKQIERKIDTQIRWVGNRQTDRQTDRQIDKQTDQHDRQIDGQTGRQIDKQIDGQIDRSIDRSCGLDKTKAIRLQKEEIRLDENVTNDLIHDFGTLPFPCWEFLARPGAGYMSRTCFN